MAPGSAFAAAIGGLGEHSTPYHLAHGLLHHALYLIRTRDADSAAAAIGEARAIDDRRHCQPLLDRADGIARPRHRIRLRRYLIGRIYRPAHGFRRPQRLISRPGTSRMILMDREFG